MRDSNSKLIVLTLLLTVCVLLIHRQGWMQIYFDALDASVSASPLGDELSASHLIDTSPKLAAACTMPADGGAHTCGLSVNLSRDKSSGVDLSKYQRVEVTFRFERPVQHHNLRLYLKNYRQAYANTQDGSSLKYNMVELKPSFDVDRFTIPLNYFQVPSWWVNKHHISFEMAQHDIGNVPAVEFSTGSVRNVPGDYKIIVDKLEFSGQFISELTLIKWLLVTWLVVGLVMLNSHRQELAKAARIDDLTGVLNRRGFHHWIDKNFICGNQDLALYYIDIDDFKRINDTFGHLAGDKLILALSQSLKRAIHRIHSKNSRSLLHCFTRISGDEFVIVFRGLDSKAVEPAAFELLQEIAEPMHIQDRDIKINASIGVAINDEHADSAEVLMNNADTAMYAAKKMGKNQCQYFDVAMAQDQLLQKKVLNGLRRALDEELFRLEYMPIFHTGTMDVIGTEVLLRCSAEELYGVSEDVYIPIAEEFGLIKEIDLWVLEETFKRIQSLGADNRISFSVNLSAMELHNKSFIGALKYLLQKYQVPVEYLMFEITETCLVDADPQSVAFLKQIHDLDIRIALDDFGTGYTAFTQLLEYPVQYLKIDKSFIANIGREAKGGNKVVETFMAIAKTYHLGVVAEGVENHDQLRYLQHAGCEYSQGFLLSKPVPWEKLALMQWQPTQING